MLIQLFVGAADSYPINVRETKDKGDGKYVTYDRHLEND